MAVFAAAAFVTLEAGPLPVPLRTLEPVLNLR